MLFSGALELWKRQRHGPRVQVKAISFISDKLDSYDSFSCMVDSEPPTIQEICRHCKEVCTPDVSVDTLKRWWKLYLEWGELPHKVVQRKKAFKGKYKHAKKNEL